MEPHRLAILTSHPIQYQAPLWRKLAKHENIDLIVYFLSDQGAVEYIDPEFGAEFRWDIPVLDGYHYKFLSITQKPVGNFSSMYRVILKELEVHRYDALLVHGYIRPPNWLAFFRAWQLGIPVFLRGTSTLLDKRSLGRVLLKELTLRILLHKVTACLYLGTCNQRFYQHYGVSENRLFFTPHVVDNDFFSQQSRMFRNQKDALRRQFGIPDDNIVILFCGKLILKKQPIDLLMAFASVRQDHPCNLMYVGDGELREDINKMVVEQNIPNVYITGFLNQSVISKAYAVADLLVLPSSHGETWGLVINEAMNFGLPIIASDKVGAAYDLVKEGVNGYVVPARNVEALAEAIHDLVVDRDKRENYGQKSLEIISGWSIETHVKGIVRAIEEVLGDTRRT